MRGQGKKSARHGSGEVPGPFLLCVLVIAILMIVMDLRCIWER